ncbi:outer membrane protein assembly factor BamB family protein [Natrarchaeobius oligotrophus]|uniref:Pyrrolo-quinoline quinone repeat domain-containing protein n=1 Tax=Natrarchaeobius chitinivorans TaxID=1679083 RepID=A0A3N6M278_NATCH|nr:PQQ-binding-like beta-propeller repeat protein [Natrarchaeobius chitinivorans]RQG97473.1 hypothetical protein EA472_19115 [Natrarchaeobius chitinivorans]
MTDSVSRRRLLASTGTVLATGLAGCGYQPAGGELDWRDDAGGSPGFTRTSDERWLVDDASLFRIRNRNGRVVEHGTGFVEVEDAYVTVYDSKGTRIWSGAAETQYAGEPAVADGRAYVPLEDGRVTALEREPATDEWDAGTDVRRRWRTDWDGADRSLIADDALVAGVHADGLVAFDADDGATRFDLGREAFGGRRIVDVAVGSGRVWAIGTDEGTDADESDGTNDDAGGTGADREPVLYGVTADGDVRTAASIPAPPGWLETSGSTAVVGVDDEILAFFDGDDPAFVVELEGPTARATPLVVEERDRLYHYADGTLEAVDVDEGRRVWSRDDYSFREPPVADADGVYGRGTGPGATDCGLVAITHEGEPWWHVPPLEELGCAGDLRLVGDRLVVIADGTLYGFRRRPGRRYTIAHRL